MRMVHLCKAMKLSRIAERRFVNDRCNILTSLLMWRGLSFCELSFGYRRNINLQLRLNTRKELDVTAKASALGNGDEVLANVAREISNVTTFVLVTKTDARIR